VVATQVHDSLLEESSADLIPYFDSYIGHELLYELRFLITRQRSNAACHAPNPRGTCDLAWAMNDFPYCYRKGEEEEQEGDEEGIAKGEEEEQVRRETKMASPRERKRSRGKEEEEQEVKRKR
jgi:hypothetical protein